jgi:hypothetical protein
VGPVSPEKKEVPLVLESLVNVDFEKYEEPDPRGKITQVEAEVGPLYKIIGSAVDLNKKIILIFSC